MSWLERKENGEENSNNDDDDDDDDDPFGRSFQAASAALLPNAEAMNNTDMNSRTNEV